MINDTMILDSTTNLPAVLSCLQTSLRSSVEDLNLAVHACMSQRKPFTRFTAYCISSPTLLSQSISSFVLRVPAHVHLLILALLRHFPSSWLRLSFLSAFSCHDSLLQLHVDVPFNFWQRLLVTNQIFIHPFVGLSLSPLGASNSNSNSVESQT